METKMNHPPDQSTKNAWLRALMLRDPGRWSSRLGALMSWLRAIGRGQRRRFGRAAVGVLAGASGITLMAMLAGPMAQPLAAAGEITVDGTCTLVDAIKAANTDAIVGSCDGTGSDVIILATDLTYTAAYSGVNALPTVTSTITIQADSGLQTITLDNTSADFRALTVSGAAANLTLQNINISGGKLSGPDGAQLFVNSDASLSISGGTLSGGQATTGDGDGGSISASYANAITLNDVTITGNSAGNKGGGLNLENLSSVSISDSRIVTNTTDDQAAGIYLDGSDTAVISGTELSFNMASGTSYPGGGGFLIDVSDLTIVGSTINGNSTNAGAGGLAIKGSTGTVSDTIITNNSADGFTGGLGIWTGAVVTVTNSTISNNTSSSYAGGVEVWRSTAVFDGVTVTDNTASSYGGGLVVWDGVSNATFIGSAISGNTASSMGGGIYASGAMTISNTDILSNTAGWGGGIYAKQTLNISDSDILGNTASNGGGGIYANNALTISGTDIKSNTAATKGGGIYATGTTTISGGTISSNAAGTIGGGIYAKNTVTISDSYILSNTAATKGGGIYSIGTTTISGGTISGNMTQVNALSKWGGGIYAKNGNLTISDGATLTANYAYSGGAIGGTGMTVNISSSDIVTNTAKNEGSGIYLKTSNLTIDETLISGNLGKSGAAVSISESTLAMTDSTVSGNTNPGDGGAGVSITGGSGQIDNVTFTENIAKYNGGGLISEYTNLTVANSTFSGNIAGFPGDGGGGGAMAFFGGPNLITNTTMVDNEGSWYGGAMFLNWYSDVTLVNSTLSGNSSPKGGGAIGASVYSDLTVRNTSIVSNSTTAAGGGMHIQLADAKIIDSIIENNSAAAGAGGVAIMRHAYEWNNTTAAITGTVISNNTAGTYGGGVAVVGSSNVAVSLTISDSDILSNTAETGDGGGLAASGALATVAISDSTFDSNSASATNMKGGAVFASGINSLAIEGSLVKANEAQSQGGAVMTENTAFSIDGSAFINNSTQGSGGALFMSTDSKAGTIENSTFSGNLANDWGGGMFLRGDSVSLVNNTISDNTATVYYGGGIYSDATNLTMTHNTVTGNSAEKGGGLYTWGNDGGVVTLQANLISGNTAATSGQEVERFSAYPITSANNVLGDSSHTNAEAFANFTPAAGDVTATSDGEDPTALTGIISTALADNGGLGTLPGDENTKTHLPAAGSPAVDILLGTECEVKTDQRGDARPKGVGCDAGAVEVGGGLISITKLTTPAGLLDVFEFTSDISGSETFTLTHGTTETMTVPAGVFTVTESASDSFNLDDISCTDGGEVEGNTATITINEGDEVSCTFTNVPAGGTLEIGKIITPTGLTDSFTFTVTDGADVTEVFELTGGMTETITLPVGTFTVTEALVDGFELIDVDCGEEVRGGRNGLSNVVEVDILKDQTTSCTFTNEVIEEFDGVEPTTEAGAPNGGDGNGDGTPDYLQNHVTSLPNGEDEAYVSIAAPDGTQMTNVSTDEAPADLPRGVRLPIGVINFSLTDLPSNGATVTVTLHLENAINADTYYKLVNGVWTEYENVEFVDNKTIVLTLTDGGPGDLDGIANGVIVDPGGPGLNAGLVDIFISTWSAGTVGDLSYGPHDVLAYDGEEMAWTTWFSGADAGLDPYRKWKHNLNAIWIRDIEGEEVIFSLTQDNRKVPGIPGIVDGMDLLHWDGDALSLWFDGQDVGLNVKTQEKIDGLHILDEAPEWSEFAGQNCQAYLLISIQGNGLVPKPGNVKPKNTMKFGGEDIVGFCATNLGPTTTGSWEMVLDGSTYKVLKNNIESLAANEDASVLYLTSQKQFRVHEAFGGHSMVFAFDMETERFSGPYVRVMDDLGIQPKVDALHVSGELSRP